MTPQQIFDKVATHLIKQGRRSSVGRVCKYRGPDGLMCAIGPLLTDEVAGAADLGNVNVFGIVNLPGELAPSLLLLSDLQEIHDDYEPERWRQLLTNLAARRNLDASVVSP